MDNGITVYPIYLSITPLPSTVHYHINIGFSTPATAASTTIIAASRKTKKIEKNGIPGKQRNMAAPAPELGSFTGSMPDWTAPARGRRKSQKVGMNCSAMITADCLHTRARGCEQHVRPK